MTPHPSDRRANVGDYSPWAEDAIEWLTRRRNGREPRITFSYLGYPVSAVKSFP